MARTRRRSRRRLVLLALLGAVAMFRQQRLDAADRDFPEAVKRPG